jgi:PiT family inorganic phosphate transporter
MEYLLIPVALFLAFGNGANDNFKGFATVWGSGTLRFRRALLLATLATAAGSILSLFVAQDLAQQFSGKGLLPEAVAAAPPFIVSVGLGAALTVLLATRTGFPISTTHALIGALVGAGLAASPGEIAFGRLGNAFLLPLLVSPVIAAALGALGYRMVRLRPERQDCACVLAPALTPGPVQAPAHAHTLAKPLQLAAPQWLVAGAADCDRIAPPPIARFAIPRVLDRLHIFSAALICFARGVNDTPKLAALLIAAHALDASDSVLLIAIVMAAGGLLFARRVAETMSRRIAQMDHAQGLAANLITSALVLLASQFALPVSTTHVSVGSIAGVGADAHTLDSTALRSVLLSWVATLPLAAFLAWAAWMLIAAMV